MFDEYKLLSLEYDYKWVNMAFPSRGKWKPNFKQKFHCLPENATLAVFVSPRCFSLLGIFWYKSHKTCLLFLVPNSALKFRGLSSNTRTGVCQVVHWLPLDVSSVLWYTNLIGFLCADFFKMHIGVFLICRSIYCMCLVFLEVRRGHYSHWHSSYRQL